MVTKEQCLLDKALRGLDYDRNQGLIQAIVSIYNQGKRYASDMIFQNDERGLDAGLRGFSPSFIVYSLIGDDSEYNARDPFFVIDNGIRSLSGYDLEGMLRNEDMSKFMVDDVFGELDDTDIDEALDEFIRSNYPQEYKNIDIDNLYYMGYRTGGHILEADWNQLVQELIQYKPDLDEGRVLEMTEDELRQIVSEGATEAYKRIKEGKSRIHIDPENKGKFTATKERTGKSTEELTHSKNPLTRKRANFARMAKRGWKPLKKS